MCVIVCGCETNELCLGVTWMECVDCCVPKRHETQPYNRELRQIPPAIPGTYGRMILSVV